MATRSASNRPSIHALAVLLAMSVAVAVLVLAVARPATAEDDHEYVGHTKCKTCHRKKEIGDQFGIWLKSPHAKAFEVLASDAAKKYAAELVVADPQHDDRCLRCHTTAWGFPDSKLSRKFDRTAGVQCEACHGAGKDYSRKKVMMNRDEAIKKGLVPQTAAVCTHCHNDDSPAWDPQRYTLADGSKVGFDYDQAVKAIAHPIPEGYDPKAHGEAD